MAYEQRDNSGALFANNRKEKDTHPDKEGTAMIGGVEYWVKGWIKEGRNGKFMSLSFKPKEARVSQHRGSKPEPARQPEPFRDDDVDNIPW